MPTSTFWLEPTGRVRVALRRYRYRDNPTGWGCDDGWHSAVVWTGEEIDEVRNERGLSTPPPAPPRDDPRWPVVCDAGCGYRFSGDDAWQAWGGGLYRRADNGGLRVLHDTITPPDIPGAEAGATWDAHWMGHYRGEDGITLMVRCPRPDGSAGASHDWCVDVPSSTGGRWTRTGDPRQATVTAHPSIAIGIPGKPGYYHGWLQDGVLSDHLG